MWKKVMMIKMSSSFRIVAVAVAQKMLHADTTLFQTFRESLNFRKLKGVERRLPDRDNLCFVQLFTTVSIDCFNGTKLASNNFKKTKIHKFLH